MKIFFWITFIFLLIGNVNAEEVFKCKKDLQSADNNEENALRLQECWNEIDNKSKKTQKYGKILFYFNVLPTYIKYHHYVK